MTDFYKKYFLETKPIIYDNLIPSKIYFDSETECHCFSLETVTLPIPISVGDILRIKLCDYRIVLMNIHLSDTIFVVRKINCSDNPDDYIKRVVEIEE